MVRAVLWSTKYDYDEEEKKYNRVKEFEKKIEISTTLLGGPVMSDIR